MARFTAGTSVARDTISGNFDAMVIDERKLEIKRNRMILNILNDSSFFCRRQTRDG